MPEDPNVAKVSKVRAVVVAWNNVSFIGRCVDALLATQWDGDLEIVVVDNGSHDGTADVVEATFGSRVRLIRNQENLGFAGGNNVALDRLDEVDAVALINSDAFVAPTWLEPLARQLDADARVAAACPKIVFEPTFASIELDSSTFVPDGPDDRTLGQRVVAIEVDGVDVWPRTIFASGWSWPEGHARWTTGHAVAWVPVRADSSTVEVRSEGRPAQRFVVGEHFDVINNVGLELTDEWYGRDRGFREIDRGQYDEPSDVWGWCGAAVLLRSVYLRDVGVFDERLFAYYEDADLSWRGEKRGWRYRCVPVSVVRHAHASSSGENSAFFDHLTQRNRLVVVSRHADKRVAVAVWGAMLREVARNIRGEVLMPLIRGRRPHPTYTARRVRASLAALGMLLSTARPRLPG